MVLSRGRGGLGQPGVCLSPSHCWFPPSGHCGLDASLSPDLFVSSPEAGAICREARPSGAGEIRE